MVQRMIHIVQEYSQKKLSPLLLISLQSALYLPMPSNKVLVHMSKKKKVEMVAVYVDNLNLITETPV